MSFITLNRIGGTTNGDGTVTGGSITGTYNGKSFGITYSQQRWDLMQSLRARANQVQSMEELKTVLDEFEPLTHESYKEVAETKSPYLYVNPVNNKFYLKYKSVISKEPLPQAFVNRILESIEKGIDPKPLVKCWARFMRNPNYSHDKAEKFAWYINQTHTAPSRVQELVKEGVSIERATEMATTYQTPITDEGLICTYKVSLEITKKYQKTVDGRDVEQVDKWDFEVDEETGLRTYNEPKTLEERVYEPAVQHSSGDAWDVTEINGVPFKTDAHTIHVGKVHALKDWKMVDCDDYRSCVPGLHCGNLDYIRSYQTNGTVTHYVFVDPMDIGAVVQDKTGALRVKAYMVYASFKGVTSSIYHSSTYAKLKDDEYDRLVEEVVTKTRDEAVSAAMEAFEQKIGLQGEIG